MERKDGEEMNKYIPIIKINFQNKLVYFWDLIGNNLFFILIMFVYLMLWKSIYADGNSSIAGITLNQMIWYLVVTEVITLSRGVIHQEVNREVKSGEIGYLLGKPYNYIFYCFSCFIGDAGVKLLANGALAVVIGLLFVGPLEGFSLVAFPFIVISILLGWILNFFIYMLLALTAFWTEENSPFFWIYSKLVFTLGGMLLPIELFPIWLQKVSKALPFVYVTYTPARLAVDFSFGAFIKGAGVQLVYLAVFITLTLFVYGKGVRKLNVNGG